MYHIWHTCYRGHFFAHEQIKLPLSINQPINQQSINQQPIQSLCSTKTSMTNISTHKIIGYFLQL